ncbi:ABC transporter ATP-binding protein [Salinactinospora qingdaonensis]|uniref:ABC transporter ATP-binding protein n=1 Tax=Salinactinospora qingdaonensis TaxID=702744 RepID=A0ABP7F6V4_9ACTN
MSDRVVIDADALGKVFDASGQKSVTALHDINLTVRAGEFVSLLGPSGCGKSTLLRVMADLTSPTSGRIEVNGKNPEQARTSRDYGMVFQQPGLFDWRSVLGNVELPLQLAGVAKSERRSRAREMLELVRLSDFARHFPWQLSGGMQQRVAIARALTGSPKLLFMDEPLGALDEMNREYLQGELLRIWDSTKTTIVFVTHSVAEAVFLSNRVVIMSPRPGQVATTVDVDLPAPRTAEVRTAPEFYDTVTEVRTALHAVLAGEEAVA